MEGKESISITIPAYNEEQTLKRVFHNALSSVSKLTNDYEIVLVNDGSIDTTGRIMDSIKKRYARKIVVVHHEKNKGFSGAMKSCYANASKDLIFLGPADGQFDYNEVAKFVKKIKTKDIVVAYRVVNKERFYRKINSFFFHLLARVLFGITLREFSSCIMYRKRVRDSITITANPFSCLFLPEFIYKAKRMEFRFGETPIHFYARAGGVQKGTNLRVILKTLWEMFIFWWKIQEGKVP